MLPVPVTEAKTQTCRVQTLIDTLIMCVRFLLSSHVSRQSLFLSLDFILGRVRVFSQALIRAPLSSRLPSPATNQCTAWFERQSYWSSLGRGGSLHRHAIGGFSRRSRGPVPGV